MIARGDAPGTLLVDGFDDAGDPGADLVVATGQMVGVVGVEAFQTPPRPTHAALGLGAGCAAGTLSGVLGVSPSHRVGELGIGLEVPCHGGVPFAPVHPPMGVTASVDGTVR